MTGALETWNLLQLKALGFREVPVQASTGTVVWWIGEGRGEGPPVVLVHGFCSRGCYFVRLARRLLGRFRQVMLVDLPGHGASDLPDAGTGSAVVIEGFTHSLEQLDPGPALLFGNSMGAVVAARYSLAAPDRVHGLVMASPAGARMSEEALRQFLAAFQVTGLDEASALIQRLSSASPVTRTLVSWLALRKLQQPRIQRLLASVGMADQFDAVELQALRVPTLVLWGQEERLYQPEHLQWFQQHLPPTARVERPPAFGHMAWLERPQEVASWIGSFAGSLDPTSAAAQAGHRLVHLREFAP